MDTDIDFDGFVPDTASILPEAFSPIKLPLKASDEATVLEISPNSLENVSTDDGNMHQDLAIDFCMTTSPS